MPVHNKWHKCGLTHLHTQTLTHTHQALPHSYYTGKSHSLEATSSPSDLLEADIFIGYKDEK